LETRVLFRGVHGRLELDLAGKDKAQAGAVMPTFYSLAGEEITLPEQFADAIRSITKATNCVGCSHCHYVRAPRAVRSDSANRASVAVLPEHAEESEGPTIAASGGDLTSVAEVA
jgi:hypothetical protein